MVDPNKNNKHRPKLTDELREEIYRIFAEGDYTQKEIAKMFDVTPMTISNVIKKMNQENQGSFA